MGCRRGITCAFIHNLGAVQRVHRGPATAAITNAVGREPLIKSALAAADDLGGYSDESEYQSGSLDCAFGVSADLGDSIDARPAVTSGPVVGMDCMGGGDLGQYSKRDAVFGTAELGQDPAVMLRIRHRNSPGDPVIVAVPTRNTGVGVVAQVKGNCLQAETA